MKMRQKFRFTASAALLAMGAKGTVYSQNTAHATMEVRVQVISGAGITTNFISDISTEITKSSGPFSMGGFQLVTTNNTEYIMEQESTVQMVGGDQNWNLNMNIQSENTGVGQTTFHLNADTLSTVPKGTYSGTYTTKINYL